jgi:hypothetical protein
VPIVLILSKGIEKKIEFLSALRKAQSLPSFDLCIGLWGLAMFFLF